MQAQDGVQVPWRNKGTGCQALRYSLLLDPSTTPEQAQSGCVREAETDLGSAR